MLEREKEREVLSYSHFSTEAERSVLPLSCRLAARLAHQGVLPFEHCGHRVGADPGGPQRWRSASVEGTLIIQARFVEAVEGGETGSEMLPQSQGSRDQTSRA